MSAPYGQTEKMLVDAVNSRIPGTVELTSFREAREWNHGEEYLRTKVNEDTDELQYYITPKGTAKAEGE